MRTFPTLHDGPFKHCLSSRACACWPPDLKSLRKHGIHLMTHVFWSWLEHHLISAQTNFVIHLESCRLHLIQPDSHGQHAPPECDRVARHALNLHSIQQIWRLDAAGAAQAACQSHTLMVPFILGTKTVDPGFGRQPLALAAARASVCTTRSTSARHCTHRGAGRAALQPTFFC